MIRVHESELIEIEEGGIKEVKDLVSQGEWWNQDPWDDCYRIPRKEMESYLNLAQQLGDKVSIEIFTALLAGPDEVDPIIYY